MYCIYEPDVMHNMYSIYTANIVEELFLDRCIILVALGYGEEAASFDGSVFSIQLG